MAVEIVRKSVSFNIADPDQAELYNHLCKRSNVSAYLKRLIQRDIEGSWRKQQQIRIVQEEIIEENDIDASLISGLV